MVSDWAIAGRRWRPDGRADSEPTPPRTASRAPPAHRGRRTAPVTEPCRALNLTAATEVTSWRQATPSRVAGRYGLTVDEPPPDPYIVTELIYVGDEPRSDRDRPRTLATREPGQRINEPGEIVGRAISH
jgi:hypothetical protein